MIYSPAEDSYLLARALKNSLPGLLKKNKNLRFLEIGCGSGLVLQEAFKAGVKKENIAGADINKESVEHCRKLGFKAVRSDLFQNIEGKFDVIVFNPPYLPKDEREPESSRRETTGGEKGNEISLRFLKQAKKHIQGKGKIFLVTSSLAGKINFEKLGFEAREIAMEKIFFEALNVWEISLNL